MSTPTTSHTPTAVQAATTRCHPCATAKPWQGACAGMSPNPRARPTAALTHQVKPPAASGKPWPRWDAEADKKPHNAGKQTPRANMRKHKGRSLKRRTVRKRLKDDLRSP